MTHNGGLQRTPHPARGGGSNTSPGVKWERGGGGEEENHRRVMNGPGIRTQDSVVTSG